MTEDAKAGKITKQLYRIPLRKNRAQDTNMHAAEQKIQYKSTKNVPAHNTPINTASSFYDLIRSPQA